MIQLLNVDRLAQGKAEIRIGIGIASGQVIAGYTGTTRRATYTCVGDTVNLAARLESHTKVVGKPILIDSITHNALSSAIKVEEEGPFQFKGKTVEVQVFSVPLNQK
jgi:adenylate cyclase